MRNRVIICSSFEMVSIGLAEIVDSLAQFDVVSCLDSPEYLSEKILTTDANIVIINPSVLGYQNKDFVFQFRKKTPACHTHRFGDHQPRPFVAGALLRRHRNQ